MALYFAMQEGDARNAALWAVDWAWLQERSIELLRQHDQDYPEGSDPDAVGQYINRILLKPDNPYIIVPACPRQINERMQIQQGQLLCSLRHIPAFSTILLRMLIKPSIVERQVVSKVFIKRERRIEFLEELRRMNIHDASLFPGLDGFARSLGVNLDISVAQQLEESKQASAEYLRSKAARN